MVNLEVPEYDSYPRFPTALETMHVVDLGPGDAMFVRSLWWRGVRASGRRNVLVNYW